jgi:hypothetical protein
MQSGTEKLIYVRPLLGKDIPMARTRIPGSSVGRKSAEGLAAQAREILFELAGRADQGDTKALDLLVELGLLATSQLEKLSHEKAKLVRSIAKLYAVWPIRGMVVKAWMEKKALELKNLGVGRRAGYRTSSQITFKNPFTVIAGAISASIEANQQLLRYRSEHRLAGKKMDELRARFRGFYFEAAPDAVPACLQLIHQLPVKPTTKQLWEAGKVLFKDTYPNFDQLPELAGEAIHLKDNRGERRSALMKQIKQAFFSLVGNTPKLSHATPLPVSDDAGK